MTVQIYSELYSFTLVVYLIKEMTSLTLDSESPVLISSVYTALLFPCSSIYIFNSYQVDGDVRCEMFNKAISSEEQEIALNVESAISHTS